MVERKAFYALGRAKGKALKDSEREVGAGRAIRPSVLVLIDVRRLPFQGRQQAASFLRHYLSKGRLLEREDS